MSLVKRMMQSGAKGVGNSLVTESDFFTRGTEDLITTSLPTLNIAYSGDIKGGLSSGITIMAGESGSGKTIICWLTAKAFQEKYPDGVVMFYDSEFGTPPEYLKALNIDTDRVIHIPTYNIEQLKFDLVSRLEEITRKDKVFVIVDSLGLLASKKEVEDAENEKSVADMSRAKAIRSLFRIVLPHISSKGVYSMFVNHTYDETGLFPKKILGGGTAVKLVANTAIIVSKSQEKDGTELAGFNVHLNIFKSRYVREKARLSMLLRFDGGFDQFSGIVELAIEAGLIIKPSNGYYQFVDNETGELLYSGKKFRLKEIETAEYLVPVMRMEKFKRHIRDSYCLANDDKQTLTQEFDINSI
jgi:RecA/RadA recombinase